MLDSCFVKHNDIIFIENTCCMLKINKEVIDKGRAMGRNDKEFAQGLDFITRCAADFSKVLYTEYFLGVGLDLRRFKNISYDK